MEPYSGGMYQWVERGESLGRFLLALQARLGHADNLPWRRAPRLPPKRLARQYVVVQLGDRILIGG